ncbi:MULTISPECIES: capsule assembly Wzi family protein [Sphingobacterium]|uniref:Capsule assembly Wzi family protein n=1 Tax=Sphingobacterium populi TaxID=1812824 RepID=A0ABW5UBW0_9SPHI|nr:capsule assembly Wzi family protein [Sphingobacterium sp. CFCC 11742]
MKDFLIAFIGIIGLCCHMSQDLNAQTILEKDTVRKAGLSLQLQAGYAGDQIAPFWMRSNQFGSVPLDGGSGSLIVRGFKEYQQLGEWKGRAANNNSLWDWGYALEGRANIGRTLQAQIIEAYAKVRFAMFEARLGRSRDVMGLNGDTLLTSGNFAVSGNALGVPKFEISIPEYYRLPWFEGLLSFKGNFANGYMGQYDMSPGAFRVPSDDYRLHTFLHQKSLYGRLGRADWKLQLFGGFNHQVQWGGENERYGSAFDLNFLQTLSYVTFGKAYGGRQGNPIPRSKIGNHQGSIDLGASYNFGNVSLMAYRQNIYEVGALSKLANIKDGLNGLTLTNNRFRKTTSNWDWKTLLVEFFYSKDQAGYPWSKPTASGDEDYYNNFEYLEGWSYKGVGMGTPLIIPATQARSGQANFPGDFFISNRVIATHIGASGHVYNWNVLTKLTYAKHYGTFATSEYGKSTGRTFFPTGLLFTPVNQFSMLLQAEKELLPKMIVGGTFALDQGKMLDSGVGLMIHARRNF